MQGAPTDFSRLTGLEMKSASNDATTQISSGANPTLDTSADEQKYLSAYNDLEASISSYIRLHVMICLARRVAKEERMRNVVANEVVIDNIIRETIQEFAAEGHDLLSLHRAHSINLVSDTDELRTKMVDRAMDKIQNMIDQADQKANQIIDAFKKLDESKTEAIRDAYTNEQLAFDFDEYSEDIADLKAFAKPETYADYIGVPRSEVRSESCDPTKRFRPGLEKKLALQLQTTNSTNSNVTTAAANGGTGSSANSPGSSLSGSSTAESTPNQSEIPEVSPFYDPECTKKVCQTTPEVFLEQLSMEHIAVQQAAVRYHEMSEELTRMGRAAQLRPAQQFVLAWYGPLAQAIQEEQQAVLNKEPGTDRRLYGPYLTQLGSSELACIVVHELLSRILMSPNGVRFVDVALGIGKAANVEVNISRLRQNKQFWMNLSRNYPGGKLTSPVVMSQAQRVSAESTWGDIPRIKLGSVLLHLLLRTAKVPAELEKGNSHRRGEPAVGDRPAFTHAFEYLRSPNTSQNNPEATIAAIAANVAANANSQQANNGLNAPGFTNFNHSSGGAAQKVGMIYCDRLVLDAIAEGHDFIASLSPRLLPMLTPPRPWRGLRVGGYLTVPSTLLRTKGSAKQANAVRQAKIPLVYESLNTLGKVPWRVNPNVLHVVERLWTEGGGVADLPARVDIPLPPPVAAPPIMSKAELEALSPEELAKRQEQMKAHKKWVKDCAHVMQLNHDLHALRCDIDLKLMQARQVLGRDIYFPFNLDFRGRAYPVPPHLNHLGSDLSRGLLCFAERKPLGPKGLYWLYAHLAAQFGVDKVSFDDRVAFAKSKFDLIKETALDPFKCQTPNPLPNRNDPFAPPMPYRELVPWWQTADSPFQALATCFEIYAAEQCEDPSTYRCPLPVHQDGSCNGLQHYAALGRDELGGARVNLMPAPKPQDVYTHVLNQVKVLLQQDAERGNEMAQELLKHVNRKVVKQTVMTSVYGVTFIGAREQIAKQLKDIKNVNWPEPVETSIYQASVYLAKLTLSSLSSVFTGAKAIMTWLGECAHLIASQHQPVSWVTPLGLPVIQPYRKAGAYQVKTLMQSVTFADNNDLLPVSSTRQKAAFPPNFVHSLDATHMMLTSLECAKRGLTFSSVHDSFWTHACDVDIMNECLRNQFIELYSRPILEDLRQSFVTRFPHINFPPLPPRGTLDLNKIRESKYFFS